jgi:hypothetical protein
MLILKLFLGICTVRVYAAADVSDEHTASFFKIELI